ncbi:MAG: DUF4350 domain-containing protein [Bryobacteraceae bacterium]
MTRTGSIAAGVGLALVLCGVLFLLFVRSFEAGDVYPDYSTLRTDPAGARLLFDSLARLPGLTVTRGYQPIDRLPDRESTIVLLGLSPRELAGRPADEYRELEALASRGNRIVLGMGSVSGHAPPQGNELEKHWRVRFGLEFDKQGVDTLYFAESPGWVMLANSLGRPTTVEKAFGNGSVVLVASGRVFSNRSVATGADTDLLARIIGPHVRIVFDEAHFGIVENGSVVALARRFRLQGVALGLALCAVLFIWKNAAAFPPIGPARQMASVAGRTSMSGLVTLLRRHVSSDRLVAAGWQEWLKGHSREVTGARKLEAERLVREGGGDPVEVLRKIQTLLRAKGTN